MKTFDKSKLLEELEEKTEGHLATAIRTFQNLDTKILLQPPPSGGWSIAACMGHLASYGDYYLPRLTTAARHKGALSSDDPFRSTWLGNYFVRIMGPDTKTKLKALKKHRMEHIPDPHAIVADFIRQREELMLTIRRAHQANLNRRVQTSLSPFIKLKLGDTLRFMVAHDARHMRQMLRVMKAIVPQNDWT